MPRVSVLVPAFNRADTLEQCVRSALDSPGVDLEVVISDNGSTDGTPALARSLAASDPRVRVILHDRNRGPLPNWRACLDAARGELTHWLWSDDWVLPGFYETLLAGMARRGAQVGVCAAKIVDPTTGTYWIAHSLPDIPRTGRDFVAVALDGLRAPVSPAAALLPTSSCRRHFTDAIPRLAGLDCNRRAIGCDALMILGSAWDAGAVFTHPDPLVAFRAHPDSISVATGGATLGAHYALARLWWGRRHGAPLAPAALDLVRLARVGFGLLVR